MSKKVSKTAIGAFVLVAVALLVAAVLVLGAGKFFTQSHTFITYYEGSVKGLSVGSPVMFRGVKIGEVEEITIVVDPATNKLMIPVVFTLEPAKFRGANVELQRDPAAVVRAVDHGLRTQLQSQSFVTGQLAVALDFFPGKPAEFVGLHKQDPEHSKYPEVPSIPTSLEELQKTVENLPLQEMVENLNETLAGIERLVSDIDAKKTMESLDVTLRESRTLMQNLDKRIGVLATSIDQAARSADAALVETKNTMATVGGDFRTTLDEMRATLAAAQSALKSSEKTMQTYGEDSLMASQMNRTLRDLSATTRSLRQVSDYLERHPEALLRGKAGE